jgi:hypothetical protein
MTLEFAKSEAERRTLVMGTSHFVVKSKLSHVDYLVMTVVPAGYTAVAAYTVEAVKVTVVRDAAHLSELLDAAHTV